MRHRDDGVAEMALAAKAMADGPKAAPFEQLNSPPAI
jgi:hypothetical protein